MNNRLNKYKYPGAKRLMLEAQELKDKTEDYCAQPIDDNLFEWHFTVRGPPDTAFEGGFYHGRLSFPTEYPMKPPSIILLNPNGRFETNKKICLSISGFHPETWQPSWSVRTALLALIAFMPTKGNRAIGSLDYSDPERRELAKHSKTWRCEICGPIKDLLKQPEDARNITSNLQIPSCASRDGGSGSQSDGSQDGNSSSDRSDSEGEIRDSLTDFQGSESTSDASDTDGLVAASSSSDQASEESSITREKTSAKSKVQYGARPNSQTASERANDDLTPVARLTSSSKQTTATAEPAERRSYPPLVFISIFILLLLLIVRRIVMILQS